MAPMRGVQFGKVTGYLAAALALLAVSAWGAEQPHGILGITWGATEPEVLAVKPHFRCEGREHDEGQARECVGWAQLGDVPTNVTLDLRQGVDGRPRFASYVLRFSQEDFSTLWRAVRAEFGEPQTRDDKVGLYIWTWPDGAGLTLARVPLPKRSVAGEWALVATSPWWAQKSRRRDDERARDIGKGLR